MPKKSPERKPSLSPTKITTYLACPTKYMWTYVNPRGRYYMRAKSYFSFGTSLHQALQRFYDAGDTGVTTASEAVAALEESWIDSGYETPDQMADALSEGKEILARHLEAVEQRPPSGKTVFIERQFRHDLGEFTVIGRVDRVDELEDGTYRIIDYKSGRESVSEDDVRNDIAMSIYQLILSRRFDDRRIEATIVALRSGEEATVQLSPEQLAELEQDLVAIGQEILRRNWEEVIPVAKPLCERCDFLPLCRQHPDYEPLLPT